MASVAAFDQADRDLVARFEAAGQGHVFRFLPQLAAAEVSDLLADARQVDLAKLAQILASAPATGGESAEAGQIEPPGDELQRMEATEDHRRLRLAAHDRGLHEIEAGRVAVVVAAGGQGTRLGSTAPKGMWPVGPLTGKPLLAWHAEKVRYWAKRVGRPIPFVVLVSDATAQATADFVRWHNHFGLDPTWIKLVKQGSLPAVDDAGRIVLTSASRIALAPNGHGGVYAALRESRVIDLLADHGVRTLAYCQVDNPLIRTLDPLFVGFHVRNESEFSSKSVMKRGPAEKVGVFGRVGGRPAIVEYSELTVEQESAIDAEGALVFGQGNIAAHCIDVAFARRMADEGLPYHRARKKVPCADATGRTVEPDRPNATKFECFVFDALPRAARTVVVEARRSDEFSPIKNATGDDTPDTARRDLIEMFRGWMRRAGVTPPDGAIEISPFDAPDEHAYRALRGLARA
ncbi:MAG: UTP--glucose-1-phosphate uridylyltransferase [Planctomycetes bacterium]|nr:UTP--glucose-1-phosphate uridylyltransferase [Planctomycetota bacterium]